MTVRVVAEWPELRYQKKVLEVIQNLNMTEMEDNLVDLTSFFNRYYRSEFGAQSSRWIYDKLLEVGVRGSVSPRSPFRFLTYTFTRLSKTDLLAFTSLSRRLPTRSPNRA